MARHGENIHKRKDGRWEARYMVRTEDTVRYRSVYGHTYEEAKEKRRKAVQAGTRTSYGMAYIGFGTLASEWLSHMTMEKKPSTAAKYRIIWEKRLEESLSSMVPGTPGFQEAVDNAFTGDISPSIQRSMRCVIGQILYFAGEKYGMELPTVRYPGVKIVRPGAVPLSRQEQTVLSGIEVKDRYNRAVLFALWTGCRLGEVCGLKWEDIDFTNQEFHVRRTVQRVSCGSSDGPRTLLSELSPKSVCSGRCIPVTDAVNSLLQGMTRDGEYVFGGIRPMEPRTLQARFHGILSSAGLKAHNFHILRHTFATNCVESGMDVKTLSELLGHADVKVTLERYVHPTMESKRRQLTALEAFCGQSHGQEEQMA